MMLFQGFDIGKLNLYGLDDKDRCTPVLDLGSSYWSTSRSDSLSLNS